MSGEDLFSDLQMAAFSVSSHGRRGERVLWGGLRGEGGVLFYKGTHPIHEGSMPMTSSPPKGPTS